MNTPKTDDGTLLKSTDLLSLLVAAFTAGEKLGQANAKSIYWSCYPEEEVSEAAPKYAKSIIGENAQALETTVGIVLGWTTWEDVK
jgi:hypothetical protein